MRDKSRSVNSIDVVFNFDCIGFTGTPFIDNYPTFATSARGARTHPRPHRPLVLHVHRRRASRRRVRERFRFSRGGRLGARRVRRRTLRRPRRTSSPTSRGSLPMRARSGGGGASAGEARARARARMLGFNVLVDLCGIFKKASSRVRDVVLATLARGASYLYHIDQSDGGTGALLESDSDVQFDEEFYKYLCKAHGRRCARRSSSSSTTATSSARTSRSSSLPEALRAPLFFRVGLAHDVTTSARSGRPWAAHAMNHALHHLQGRRRGGGGGGGGGGCGHQGYALTRAYVRNCD